MKKIACFLAVMLMAVMSYGYSNTTAGVNWTGTRVGNAAVVVDNVTGAIAISDATGMCKVAANGAYQIGTGSNGVANTVKIKNTTILDANGALPVGTLGAGSVTYTNMATGSVTTTNIVDKTIGTIDIANGGITYTNMGTGSVTGTNIVNDTIMNADVNSSAAIAISKLAKGFVCTTNGSTANIMVLSGHEVWNAAWTTMTGTYSQVFSAEPVVIWQYDTTAAIMTNVVATYSTANFTLTSPTTNFHWIAIGTPAVAQP